ncbi:polyprenyl synthetase family protein [Patescibacteria group bacterium]|nr:polyprenyl synthetase family protein [Patescibacteria group bacterium]
MDMASFRVAFEPYLAKVTEERLQRFSALAQDNFLASIVAGLPPLLAGGKRLRPYLAQIGYAAGSGVDEQGVMELGVGLELFHVFCLVHDDIIDKAPVRRGVPTIESVAFDRLTSGDRRGDLPHVARGHAMLLGDLLFSWSLEMVQRSASRSTQPALVHEQMFAMIDEVVVGQMIDVDTMTRDEYDAALLERKIYLKTASYSFVRPMLLGLALSGSFSSELEKALRNFAEPIGVAFQIQDDLFDVISSAEELGKPVLADVRDGQQTLLTAHLALHADEKVREMLRLALLGDAAALVALPEVFISSGAVASAQARVEALLREADQAVAELPVAIQASCHDLVRLLQKRTS